MFAVCASALLFSHSISEIVHTIIAYGNIHKYKFSIWFAKSFRLCKITLAHTHMDSSGTYEGIIFRASTVLRRQRMPMFGNKI